MITQHSQSQEQQPTIHGIGDTRHCGMSSTLALAGTAFQSSDNNQSGTGMAGCRPLSSRNCHTPLRKKEWQLPLCDFTRMLGSKDGTSSLPSHVHNGCLLRPPSMADRTAWSSSHPGHHNRCQRQSNTPLDVASLLVTINGLVIGVCRLPIIGAGLPSPVNVNIVAFVAICSHARLSRRRTARVTPIRQGNDLPMQFRVGLAHLYSL